jgi:hypothetical protein
VVLSALKKKRVIPEHPIFSAAPHFALEFLSRDRPDSNMDFSEFYFKGYFDLDSGSFLYLGKCFRDGPIFPYHRLGLEPIRILAVNDDDAPSFT